MGTTKGDISTYRTQGTGHLGLRQEKRVHKAREYIGYKLPETWGT